MEWVPDQRNTRHTQTRHALRMLEERERVAISTEDGGLKPLSV